MTRIHAVLIGINKYTDPSIPDLSYARQDASALRDLLAGSAHASSVVTYPLLDSAATRANIIDFIGVELPGQSRKDDIVLIYFAGHGSPEIHPGLDRLSRFLVCHDTTRAGLLSTAIDVRMDLGRLAARFTSRLVLFVLDACFSGYGGGRGIAGPRLEERRRLNRPRPRLDALPLGAGLVFLAACADDEVAWEEPRLGHGLFSYHLLAELSTPGSTDVIGLPTLYDLIYERVRAQSGGRQNPILWGNVQGARLPRLI
ncbi:MAG TPA: caspase family protein [Streptosporangiaceae bacterium]